MPIAAVTADFNNDGKPDLAVANAGSSSVSIFLGNGDGTFMAASTVTIPGNCSVTNLTAGDFTGDRNVDLLAVCSFQTNVWVLPGLGSGQFGGPISSLNTFLFDGFIGTEITNVAVDDFNGDGMLDFAAVTSDYTGGNSAPIFTVSIFSGKGDGTFALSSSLAVPEDTLPNVLIAADLNGDGITDLALADTSIVKSNPYSEILLYQGLGKGSFQQLPPLKVSGYLVIGAMTVADVNGDGKPDLIVAGADSVEISSVTSSTLMSLLNQGNFGFTASPGETEANQVGILVPGNFRGTGRLDLVEELLDLNVVKDSGDVTPLNQVAMAFRESNGDGTFQPPTPISVPGGLAPLSIQIAVGDWNGDGLPDLAFAASPSSATFGVNPDQTTSTLNFSIINAAYDAMPAGSLVAMLDTLAPPPAIKLSNSQLQFSAAAGGGDPAPQTVNLSNGGGGALTWTATSSANWLTVTPSSGTGSAALSVSAAVGSLTAGPYAGTITISAAGAATQTISVTFTLTAASTAPQIAGVVNGASFLPGIESGSWVTIQGVNLSNTKPGRIWTASEIVNGNLPESLDGTSVTIDGKPAYVYYISPTQLNVQAPTDSVTGPVNVVVNNNGQISSAFQAQLQTYSPAFFLYGDTSYAIASHFPDYALVGNPSVIPGTVAAAPGDILIFWATGFGPTTPITPAGVEVTSAPAASVTPVITIGGTPVTVLNTVLTPQTAGLYQIAVQLPPTLPSGAVPIQASVGGIQSPVGILVYVGGK
ncbi:MAG TPA: FG-GAP-like repeat-containing protein [Bryobacteraceae bacterium]|nr:FG-GAP-like repeat-containing protein [Bryobacteraceae bacterium]